MYKPGTASNFEYDYCTAGIDRKRSRRNETVVEFRKSDESYRWRYNYSLRSKTKQQISWFDINLMICWIRTKSDSKEFAKDNWFLDSILSAVLWMWSKTLHFLFFQTSHLINGKTWLHFRQDWWWYIVLELFIWHLRKPIPKIQLWAFWCHCYLYATSSEDFCLGFYLIDCMCFVWNLKFRVMLTNLFW